MKKEIKKAKRIDISEFEILDSSGNALLKGGFSPVYDESLVSGGFSIIKIVYNKCNTVAGCGCSTTTE